MKYTIKQYDNPLVTIDLDVNSAEPNLKIEYLYEENQRLLPIDMELSEKGIEKWLKQRTIPKNRAFVNEFLARCGMNINRPMAVLSICRGLSLNDSYWVTEEGFDETFSKYNLYENNFSRVLGLVAFTGYGSTVRSGFDSSPEFTTNGMLPKCWRRIGGKIMLYKGGTSGFANTGNEPYSEYYAAQVAQAMGIDAVSYGLSRWKGQLCSTCELFTDIDHSFIPAGRLIKRGGMESVIQFAEQLGDEYMQAIRNMLVFDAVIVNTDRHYGNFGFIVNNKANKICRPAPLFDHGNSLFNYAGDEYLQSEEKLSYYIKTLTPCVYDDFIETAQKYMNDENREQLRSLLNFKFTKHARYNLAGKKLKLIENQIQSRARLLLG